MAVDVKDPFTYGASLCSFLPIKKSPGSSLGKEAGVVKKMR